MRHRHTERGPARRSRHRAWAPVRALAVTAALAVAGAAFGSPARAELAGSDRAADAVGSELADGASRSTALALRVSYRAPPGCPTGVEFLATLQRHLAAGGEGAVDSVVEITGPQAGRYELELELRV